VRIELCLKSIKKTSQKQSEKSTYKKKVVLLGGLESLKDEFQRKVSSNFLSIEHKKNIGVSISTIDYYESKKTQFNYFLWNIDCGISRSFIRTTFYTGAEAIIVFISEDKVPQILPYFNEIKFRMPVITLIFCIILKDQTTKKIIDTYFRRGEFETIFADNDFRFKYIKNPNKIFKQVSSSFLEKVKTNELKDNFIINFIPFEILVEDLKVNTSCNDYFEPNRELVSSTTRLNVEKIKQYINQLGIEVDHNHPDWVRIHSKNFGIFSVFLRNGSVYLSPKNCLNCKSKRCLKSKKIQHFICIESENDGWTNVKGLEKKELLVISKILALREATIYNLPKSILKQINKIKKCIEN
jgi:hypothetical protein